MNDIETVEVPTTEIIGECSAPPELTPEQLANRLTWNIIFRLAFIGLKNLNS